MSTATAEAIGREIADNLAAGDIINGGDAADMVASTIAAQFSKLTAQRDAMMARSATCWLDISRAQDVVRKIQWCAYDTYSRRCKCPACGAIEHDKGHTNKCEIARFLALTLEDLIGPPAPKEPAP